jgi:protein-S-isoprenylcysteine O-methyltransferase Ste14
MAFDPRCLMPSGPRVARPASRGWNSLKTVAQIAVMWGLLLGVLPLGIDLVGAMLFAVASLLGLATANALVRDGEGTPLPLDTVRKLVVSGPYRHVRNPMAMFGFAQGFAVGLWLGSPAVLVYTAAGIMIWQGLARPWEEADLERRFGDRYRCYRAAVHCWIPRLTPFTDDAVSPP